MRGISGVGFVMFVLALAPAPAQHQHPPAQAAPPAQSAEAWHHTFLQMERDALAQGQGFGMALAADRNGYPGPKHILELKEPLKLTPEQEAAVAKLMAEMKQKAIARGREILAAEQRLEEMFRAGRPEPDLREETYRIATLRAQLRWVHLEAHIAARALLTAEQRAAYQRLRHGGAQAHGAP
jgi:Spy/CpxP family protein refolding chaperone